MIIRLQSKSKSERGSFEYACREFRGNFLNAFSLSCFSGRLTASQTNINKRKFMRQSKNGNCNLSEPWTCKKCFYSPSRACGDSLTWNTVSNKSQSNVSSLQKLLSGRRGIKFSEPSDEGERRFWTWRKLSFEIWNSNWAESSWDLKAFWKCS